MIALNIPTFEIDIIEKKKKELEKILSSKTQRCDLSLRSKINSEEHNGQKWTCNDSRASECEYFKSSEKIRGYCTYPEIINSTNQTTSAN